MSNESATIIQKIWNFFQVLRDDVFVIKIMSTSHYLLPSK